MSLMTVDEIRKKATRQYYPYLQAWVAGTPFFPLAIQFRKAKASDDYLALKEWVVGLLAQQGIGYRVQLEERNFRQYGVQSLPALITIENEDDFLRLIGKTEEFKQWQTAAQQTLTQFPQLRAWLEQYPHYLLSHCDDWQEILLVCRYFVANPHPNLYMRELPIPVHTKFIEEHKAILRILLDELLPPHAIQPEAKQFEERFGLKYDEPLIRLRMLDTDLIHQLGWLAPDVSIRLSDCAQLPTWADLSVLIVENKMTFLTLPALPNTLAIWGKGFQVGILTTLPWLKECPIAYWGDIDAQGFAILSQLRGIFPQVRSVMMDAGTLTAFQQFAVKGTPTSVTQLPHLTETETALYQHLVTANIRLEQERIHHKYIVTHLSHP